MVLPVVVLQVLYNLHTKAVDKIHVVPYLCTQLQQLLLQCQLKHREPFPTSGTLYQPDIINHSMKPWQQLQHLCFEPNIK